MARDPFSQSKGGGYRDIELGDEPLGGGARDGERGGGVDDWEQEEQQSLMRQQDSTLDVLSGTLGTIGGQARLMGREVGEQNDMLNDLDTHVEGTEAKLNMATRKIQDFLKKSEEKGSGWCIVILTIVLVVLLVAVILV